MRAQNPYTIAKEEEKASMTGAWSRSGITDLSGGAIAPRAIDQSAAPRP
jgi:hypothetical protein